jgi:hypothetical protein
MNRKTNTVTDIKDISPKQWLEIKFARTSVLDFFKSHPFAAFNHLTLVHAIGEDCASAAIDAALWQLIHEGRLACRRQDNDRLYRLSVA